MNKQPEGRKGQDGRGAPAWRGKGGSKGRPFRGGPKAPAGASDEKMLEGRNAVTEALRSGREIDKIYFAQGAIGTLGHLVAQARKQGITAQEIDRRKLDAMSITGSHQGIIALCAAVPYRSVEDMLALARERGRTRCWCCVTASPIPIIWERSSVLPRWPGPMGSSSPAGAAPP